MNRPEIFRPGRGAGIAGLLAAVLLAGGCASPAPAPVETRGGVSPQPGQTTPSRAYEPTASEGTAGTQATVIPLGGETAPERVTSAAPAPAPTPRAAPQRPANPAVVALLNTANQQSRSGQHAGAASSLERAIKIDPANAWLWHRLASTRLDQGRPGEAASLAAKSNSLASGDPELQADNWRLIARVHRLRGEAVAAGAAEERARRLSVPRT